MSTHNMFLWIIKKYIMLITLLSGAMPRVQGHHMPLNV